MVSLAPVPAALVHLSGAIAAGGSDDVARAAEDALDAGADVSAVHETLLQSYLFLGFPRAIEAFFAARPVLERRRARVADGAAPRPAEAAAPDPAVVAPDPAAPSPDPAVWRRNGEALCRRVYGRNYEKLMETMRGLSPELASWMILEGYGKTLSRPGLGTVEREYAVVAILTVTRMWRQLRSHAIGAVNVGGTRAGVRETIELCRAWTDERTIAEALRAVGLEEEDARR